MEHAPAGTAESAY